MTSHGGLRFTYSARRMNGPVAPNGQPGMIGGLIRDRNDAKRICEICSGRTIERPQKEEQKEARAQDAAAHLWQG